MVDDEICFRVEFDSGLEPREQCFGFDVEDLQFVVLKLRADGSHAETTS